MSSSGLIWHLCCHCSNFALQIFLNSYGIFFTFLLPISIHTQIQGSLWESDARKENLEGQDEKQEVESGEEKKTWLYPGTF
jgi:hypothetical protein